MQNLTRVVRVGTAILASVVLCCGLALPLARATGPAFAQSIPSLAVREIKITGDELIVLQATTDIADLSEYWVGYTGSDTANPGSIVPTQQLPPRPLRAGQALLLTSDGGATCDAVLTTKLSVSLADTKGTFVVRHLASDGMSSTLTTVDSVNWAKPAASGTTTAQLDLRKETAIPTPVWYHNAGGAHPWRVGSLAGCTLTLASLAAGTVAEVVEWGQSPVEPLALIENINEVVPTPDEQAIPAENTGLMSPLITELLANPSGTGTDATDEFIELYNPNDRAFGLAGFTLQTGLSTKHSYVLPAGLVIPAKSFRALYASETGLSMSNTSGQATLLDAQGVVVTQSDPYDSAPDGQAWALAQGVWYWTTKPTPAATNIIAQPIAKPATAVTKLLATAGKTASVKKPAASTAKTASVKGASTKKPAKTVKKTTKELASTNASQTVPVAKPTGVHPAALAVVALGALGYGAYAYRRDMAHAFQRVGRRQSFGASVGARLRGGEVIELVSDLGGGKTTLVRGLARGAGSSDVVASPTFTISRQYDAPKLRILHFDLYRLDEPGLIADELTEYIQDQQTVVVLEWSEMVQNVLPAKRVTIELQRTKDEGRAIVCRYSPDLAYLFGDHT